MEIGETEDETYYFYTAYSRRDIITLWLQTWYRV